MSADHPRFGQGAVPADAFPPSSVDAADANVCWEWVESMEKIGFTVLLVVAFYTDELWKHPAFEVELGEELTTAGLGHFDSAKFGGNSNLYYFYIHRTTLTAGLKTIKDRLAALGLLTLCQIGHADAKDKCWRKFYPELEKGGS
jgi:hypothetical protein